MNMERLSNKTLENAINVYETTIKACEGYEYDDDAYNPILDKVIVEFLKELQEYRSLEEQGLLLKLPCKVGDMVYVLEPCHCYNNYKENQNCHHAKTKATKYIEVVRVSKKYNSRSNTNCVKLYERPFKMDYLTKIGKTVFLTREEALEEMGE